MKKFHFSLKSLATVRDAKESRAREIFTAAVNATALTEQKLREVRARIAAFEQVLLNNRADTFRPADQVSFLNAHRREVAHEVTAVSEVEKAKSVQEQRKAEWLLARRDLRLITKLEEKARGLHQKEEEREAQRLLDDRTNALASRDRSLATLSA